MELAQAPKKYNSNHSIVSSCPYHVIFCPQSRRTVWRPPLDTRLKELILEKQTDYGSPVLGMEVMPDHVHLLLDANPQIGIVKIVGQIKGTPRLCCGQSSLGSRNDCQACGPEPRAFLREAR